MVLVRNTISSEHIDMELSVLFSAINYRVRLSPEGIISPFLDIFERRQLLLCKRRIFNTLLTQLLQRELFLRSEILLAVFTHVRFSVAVGVKRLLVPAVLAPQLDHLLNEWQVTLWGQLVRTSPSAASPFLSIITPISPC